MFNNVIKGLLPHTFYIILFYISDINHATYQVYSKSKTFLQFNFYPYYRVYKLVNQNIQAYWIKIIFDVKGTCTRNLKHLS